MALDPTPGFNLGITHFLTGGTAGPAPAPLVKNDPRIAAAAFANNNVSTWGTGAAQPTGNHNTGATYSGSTVDPQTQALYNQNAGIINSALSRLPNQLAIAQGNIRGQFDQNLNELNSGKAATDQQYGQSTNQNQQQFVTNKNQINDQASSGLRSLLSVLGQHGAGGSSAALYAAPNAVGTVASQQRSGAGQTFGQNQQSLDTNYATYNTGYDNSKKQLNDWLDSQTKSAQSQSDQTRQGLLSQLAGLQPTVAAAQPYYDQINGLANEVDQLAKLNPTYTGTTPTYTAPTLDSYTVNQTGAPVLGGGGNGTGAGATPFLGFLPGQKNKNQLIPNFNF